LDVWLAIVLAHLVLGAALFGLVAWLILGRSDDDGGGGTGGEEVPRPWRPRPGGRRLALPERRPQPVRATLRPRGRAARTR
jgi:hypothetical protein